MVENKISNFIPSFNLLGKDKLRMSNTAMCCVQFSRTSFRGASDLGMSLNQSFGITPKHTSEGWTHGQTHARSVNDTQAGDVVAAPASAEEALMALMSQIASPLSVAFYLLVYVIFQNKKSFSLLFRACMLNEFHMNANMLDPPVEEM